MNKMEKQLNGTKIDQDYILYIGFDNGLRGE